MIILEFFGGPLDGQIYEQPETSVFFRDGQHVNWQEYLPHSAALHHYQSDLPWWDGRYGRVTMAYQGARALFKKA